MSSRAVRGGTSSPRPIWSACSIVDRRRRSGQASCCTWATTTRSHSRPLDRCAVSSRTGAPPRALGRGGGRHPPRGAAPPLLAQGVRGDLLGDQPRQEVAHAGGAGDGRDVALLRLAGGNVEERNDGVEVAVGPARGGPAVLDRTTQPARPV